MVDKKTTNIDIGNQSRPQANSFQSRMRTSTIRLACWTAAWVAATALMAFGPKFLWDKALALTLLAVGLNVAVGIGWILANRKYVTEMDELQRKVYVEALAITVGVAVIVVIPYSILVRYGLSPFQANIGHLVILMSVTFMVSCVYGTVRYR